MIDIFLLIVVIILALILIGVNIYLLVYYSHPDDEGFGASIWPKCIVVLGLTLAFAQILILPLDVSNARGDGNGFRVDIFWQIVLITVACYIVFLAPFSLFFYEADDEETLGAKLGHALKMELFVIVILVILFLATYFFFNEAKIPIDNIQIEANAFQTTMDNLTLKYSISDTDIVLDVSFTIYIIAVFSWFGWYCYYLRRWFFSIYAGVGLIALPYSLVQEYINRPKRMLASDFQKERQNLANELGRLKGIGDQIKREELDCKNVTGWWATRRKKNAVKNDTRKLEIAVSEAGKKFELLKIQADYNRRAHPIWYAIKLVLGIIFAIISLFWVLHMYFYLNFSLLFMLIRSSGLPNHSFLNNLFVWLEEKHTGFIGVIFFGFFAYYILWACIKGNIMFGLRFFCVTFYPMVPNETFMNSFIVNVLLFNVWSIALLHFCTIAFSDYARFTDASMIFSVQLMHMNFFKYFCENNVFIYIMLIMMALTIVYFSCCMKKERLDITTLVIL